MKTRVFFLNRLSIQQRLPLLVFIFLLSAIVLYGLANYYSLKKATLIIGKDRLTDVSAQLSTMLGQSARVVIKASNAAAASNAVQQFIKTGGKESREEAVKELNKLSRDSTWVSMEVVDPDGRTLLRSNLSKIKVRIDTKSVLSFNHLAPDSGTVGKIYLVKDSMFHPIISVISDQKRILGYIICWKYVRSTPKALAQLSELVGTGAGIYVGNIDGSLWTNTVKPIVGLPFHTNHPGEMMEYKNAEGRKMLAKSQFVPFTNWIVVIEFPEDLMLSGVNNFVNLILIGGGVLSIVGILLTWIMGRNITKPLIKLTKAASAISHGDYSASVDVYRKDELGELGGAFNIMANKVSQMHQELENKVAERTRQLENANKELEAFSYSVSHDLRTPLRAVSGYSMMLKEDYEGKLDAEGMRIIGNIITNAKMMGQLIDELLAFSRLGKKELALSQVDMGSLAESVTDELLHNEATDKYHINIDPLPAIEADRGMIKQVLMNLISNAIKYSSKKDEPQIEVGGKEETDRAVYYVRDNGVGFDMDYASKLFGVFQRLHSQEEFEGTGVGLALVKRIIDKHHGEVWAEARENIGATFYFSIPKV